MVIINARNRLINSLKGQPVARPPFICPGGMMNMATADILQDLDLTWNQVYGDPERFAGLVLQVSQRSGIDNLGLPFCMTVEAESLGAEIEMGSQYTEPRVARYSLTTLSEWHELENFDFTKSRMAVMLKAVDILRRSNSGLPIVATLTGPVSLAASLIEPMTFFRSMRTEPAEVKAFMNFISSNLTDFAQALAEAGADILAVADPSASGEILGPAFFTEFALPYINQIISRTEEYYLTSLIHICGRLNSIFAQVQQLHSPGISIDSATSVAAIRAAVPGKVIVGNISTQLLQNGNTERVKKAAFHSLSQGVTVLAPACGISMSTPLPNLQAMAEAVRDWPQKKDPGQELTADES